MALTDTGLIITSIIGLMGLILMIYFNNQNWFKKENWKFKAYQIKQSDAIKLAKLRKDLGLNKKNEPISSVDTGGIGKLIDKYLGGDEEEEGDNWITDAIAEVARRNPQLVQSVISKVAGNQQEENLPAEFKGVHFEE